MKMCMHYFLQQFQKLHLIDYQVGIRFLFPLMKLHYKHLFSILQQTNCCASQISSIWIMLPEK